MVDNRLRDEHEEARLAAWRLGLILDLGAALRQVIRHMWPDSHGLVILMDVAKRFKASAATVQGMKLYWQMLSEGKFVEGDSDT